VLSQVAPIVRAHSVKNAKLFVDHPLLGDRQNIV
jgi:hypothetical protein